jgi:ParB family transcriptional regulator, chromosome partitioning protein
MNTAIVNAIEYRDLPLTLLTESPTNPRRIFEESALKELAETVRDKGVLSPLLVRPLSERSFEIVFGARRFRAAQMAEVATVPVRIKNMTDAEVLEAQLIENLQRRDVHPMEEAEGYKRLLTLDEPTYSIEQIAAKVGKTPVYIAQRLKLTELCEAVVDAFYRSDIGVGHALMLAKLPADLQQQGLTACFKEVYTNQGDKPARILLPVRNLRFWIETNVLLLLKDAPFDKRNAHLVAIAGSCVDCPNRTGHNKLLFADLGKQDACTNPGCFQAKIEAHIAVTVAAKPKLVQISTLQGQQREGSPVLPRNKYVAIREDKPEDKQRAQWPEHKTCRFVTEAIVTEGHGQGTIQKVCTNAECPVHHPKPKKQMPNVADNAKWKAEQEKQRTEAAIANTTGIRILAAITAAVPVRLMKRDLLFVVERLATLLDENRLAVVAKQHGIKRAKDSDSIAKLFAAYLRRAEESALGRVLVELTIVHAATRQNGALVLRDAATLYKVDADAVTLKVKQEFAVKEKARKDAKAVTKNAKKAA